MSTPTTRSVASPADERGIEGTGASTSTIGLAVSTSGSDAMRAYSRSSKPSRPPLTVKSDCPSTWRTAPENSSSAEALIRLIGVAERHSDRDGDHLNDRPQRVMARVAAGEVREQPQHADECTEALPPRTRSDVDALAERELDDFVGDHVRDRDAHQQHQHARAERDEVEQRLGDRQVRQRQGRRRHRNADP